MKKVLVTEAERRWIAENATITMGSKITQKVIDLDKVARKIVEKRKRKNLSMQITILPISPNDIKNRNHQSTFEKDPITGVLYGIAVSSDDFGNIKWQKVQINDMLSLNLDNINDAKIWTILRFSPNLEGSPFQGRHPYYRVYDPVNAAIKEDAEIEAMEKAFERVRKVCEDPRQMVQFARYMGEDVLDNTNFRIVRGSLLKLARHNFTLFNQRWETRARSFAEIFYSAHALGIIIEDANSGYMFNSIPLGASKKDAIKAISKDNSVMSSIVNELQSKDKAVANVHKTMKAGVGAELEDEETDNDFE